VDASKGAARNNLKNSIILSLIHDYASVELAKAENSRMILFCNELLLTERGGKVEMASGLQGDCTAKTCLLL
jgi:hypothetical protein